MLLEPLPSRSTIHAYLFQVAGAHRVVTVELHASQIQEQFFFTCETVVVFWWLEFLRAENQDAYDKPLKGGCGERL